MSQSCHILPLPPSLCIYIDNTPENKKIRPSVLSAAHSTQGRQLEMLEISGKTAPGRPSASPWSNAVTSLAEDREERR